MQDRSYTLHNTLHRALECDLSPCWSSTVVQPKIEKCIGNYISDILELPLRIGEKIAQFASGRVIGLVGKIGVGKTLVQTFLEDIGFRAYAFADPIKKIATILGFQSHQVYGTQKQKLERNSLWGISGRRFLQVFGTQIGRKDLPGALPEMNDIWIRCFFRFRIAHWFDDIVVGDVRFLDEADALKKLGGVLVRIERPTLANGCTANHVSEREVELIKCYAIISNHTTKLELLRKVQTLTSELRLNKSHKL